jgi:hypothetical protein
MSTPDNSLPRPAGPRRRGRAARIDFDRLMAPAAAESGFRVDAKASAASVSGLLHYINSTWLNLVRRFGEKYGLGDLARHITTDAGGQVTVADPALREQILGLRKDAALSAALAVEYARINKNEIEQALGRPAGNAELYLAHFLGATGAAVLLQAVAQNGDAVGAVLLPRAAAANRAVFFDEAGRARRVGEIYQAFARQIDGDAQRFAGAKRTSTPAAVATDVPGFISRLGFHGQQLSQPMVSMLNAFALSALQLLARPASLALPRPRAS